MHDFLQWLALPQFGLSTVFVVALISATLLPLGSEPAVVGLLQLNSALFWPAIWTATAGNTIGGAISWWMGWGGRKAWMAARQRQTRVLSADRLSVEEADHIVPARGLSRRERRARVWLRRWGAKTCLLSWLPIVGDPLCAVAGWLRLPFWPCLVYMAIGKFLRYLVMTSAILWVWPV